MHMSNAGASERASTGTDLSAACAARIRDAGLHNSARDLGVDPAVLLSASIGEPISEDAAAQLERALLPARRAP
jgi:hypothetical protein